MANTEHLKMLGWGAFKWNQWRKDNPKVIPDLSEVYLSEMELSGADLSKADLHGADLSKANLYGVDLSKANLCASYLHTASLRETDLTRARFGGTLLAATDLFVGTDH